VAVVVAAGVVVVAASLTWSSPRLDLLSGFYPLSFLPLVILIARGNSTNLSLWRWR